MIYLDSSVALAAIMSEPRRPPSDLWAQTIGSSRLLQFEVWNRLHAYAAPAYRQMLAKDVLAKVGFVEMSTHVLSRALNPFPLPLRTLDGLHLATMLHLVTIGETVELASYDARLLAAAGAIGIPAAPL